MTRLSSILKVLGILLLIGSLVIVALDLSGVLGFNLLISPVTGTHSSPSQIYTFYGQLGEENTTGTSFFLAGYEFPVTNNTVLTIFHLIFPATITPPTINGGFLQVNGTLNWPSALCSGASCVAPGGDISVAAWRTYLVATAPNQPVPAPSGPQVVTLYGGDICTFTMITTFPYVPVPPGSKGPGPQVGCSPCPGQSLPSFCSPNLALIPNSPILSGGYTFSAMSYDVSYLLPILIAAGIVLEIAGFQTTHRRGKKAKQKK